MQAIKYAATASRFDVDTLAEVHADYLKRTGGEVLTSEQAKDKITGHAELLAETEETLRKPRIVLIAGSFPTSVTATAEWLSEMDMSITLMKVQAYRTATDTVITVSQLWPLAQAEDFVVAPVRQVRKPQQVVALPVVEWTSEDLQRLRSDVVNQTSTQPSIYVRRAQMNGCPLPPFRRLRVGNQVSTGATTAAFPGVLQFDSASLDRILRSRPIGPPVVRASSTTACQQKLPSCGSRRVSPMVPRTNWLTSLWRRPRIWRRTLRAQRPDDAHRRSLPGQIRQI